MKPYLALARVRARAALAYRFSFVLGMFAMLFQLFAMMAIWRVMLSSGTAAGFDWPHMKAYLLVGFFSSVLVTGISEWGLAGRVLDGRVALDLTKPVDFQTARFAESIGSAWAEILAAVVVSAGVLLVTGPIPVPPAGTLVLFGLSLVAVVPLKFLVVYLTSLICFYTQNYLGVLWSRQAIVSLLSGALVPLTFLPGWLQAVAAVLPFASLASTPGLIFVGQATGSTALGLVGLQVFWAIVLWFAGRLFFSRAVRQITIHGG
jgi:ABC-2 type transport system permease protein